MALSFIEASKLVSNTHVSNIEKYLITSSVQVEKLDVFIKAHAIKSGFKSNHEFLSFNTLNQYLIQPDNTKHHVVIIFPWDLCPQLDWRLGIYLENRPLIDYLGESQTFWSKLDGLTSKRTIYCDFEISPALLNAAERQILRLEMHKQAVLRDAVICDSGCFSLASYLANGCPFASSQLSEISELISSCVKPPLTSKKVLVTDFDNVMWNGIIGEDGLEEISWQSEGAGFIHYVYQSYLKKLKESGVLIAGVSRNDEQLANLPFDKGRMPFKREDFVALIASYNAKSSQILALSNQLNLPLDSFVFVDDNPLELEEVANGCSETICLRFPAKAEEFLGFLNRLTKYFDIKQITNDDLNRTSLYKTRAAAIIPSTESGSDLTDYLTTLEMKVNVTRCNRENATRAIQLINKTNQFNSNGVRVDHSEIISKLNDSITLYSFELSDKHGKHGEVAVILFDNDFTLQNFVISCRVFQRRLEYYILLWIYSNIPLSSLSLSYQKTDKNIPFQSFLQEVTQKENNSELESTIDLTSLYNRKKSILDLFSGKSG